MEKRVVILVVLIAVLLSAIYFLSMSTTGNVVSDGEYRVYSSRIDESFIIRDFDYAVTNNRASFVFMLENTRDSDRNIEFNFYQDGRVSKSSVILAAGKSAEYKLDFPLYDTADRYVVLNDGLTYTTVEINISSDSYYQEQAPSVSGNVVNDAPANESNRSFINTGFFYGFMFTMVVVMFVYSLKARRDKVRELSKLKYGRFIELDTGM